VREKSIIARPWRVLVVEDNKTILGQLTRRLSKHRPLGLALEIEGVQRFSAAIPRLETCRFDLVILDVADGDAASRSFDAEAGIRALDGIKRRRFVPVIFYTALPQNVRDLSNPPLISVVEKKAGIAAVETQITDVFRSRLPELNRLLMDGVDGVTRDYMWEFASTHWTSAGLDNPHQLARVLARRIGEAFSESLVAELPARQENR
jgi:CheY-like chemotaxis protein